MGLLFVLVLFTSLCIIGLITGKPELVLMLVIYFVIHVLILGVLDILIIKGVVHLDVPQSTYDLSNAIINCMAYTGYMYFMLVFYSLYVDCVERKNESLAAPEEDDDHDL